jgi:hypothetical protein
MTDIKNTTAAMKDDPAEPLLFLAEAMAGGGQGVPIERQERDGQRQLVNSDRLPADRRGDFEALGFTFGEPDGSDPMFCPATLPPGWNREGSDHAMWSYITDEHGRQRVAIFYKAAFYDRSAFMRLESVEWYVTKHVQYDGPLVITDDWATRETVRAAMEQYRDAKITEAAQFRKFASDESNRDAANRERCGEIADEQEADAAKYTAAIAAFEAGGE